MAFLREIWRNLNKKEFWLYIGDTKKIEDFGLFKHKPKKILLILI